MRISPRRCGFEVDVWTDNHVDTPRDERERMETGLALMGGSLQLRRWAHDMLFAANLAWPGVAALQGGAVFRRRREIDTLKTAAIWARFVAVWAHLVAGSRFLHLELRPDLRGDGEPK